VPAAESNVIFFWFSEPNTMATSAQVPSNETDAMPSFVLRLGKLPFVETAVSTASSFYQTYGKVSTQVLLEIAV
jgi:hypothetical protein